MPHLLQLLFQAQMVLDLLAGVVVAQPIGVHQLLWPITTTSRRKFRAPVCRMEVSRFILTLILTKVMHQLDG